MAATGWPSYSTTSGGSSGSSLRIGAMSFLPGMSAAAIAATTPGAASARAKVDAQDAGVRVRAQHQRGFERARHVRHVVEIERAAGDMADGAVVAHGGVDAAADAAERCRS